jgi:hypothetical protein
MLARVEWETADEAKQQKAEEEWALLSEEEKADLRLDLDLDLF